MTAPDEDQNIRQISGACFSTMKPNNIFVPSPDK